MELPPEVFELGLKLTEAAARNSATAVTNRIRSAIAAGKKDDAIAALEEIVSELLADKQELTRIAQAYQAELVAQRLAAGDVQYIAGTVVPLLEELAGASPEGQQMARSIDALKPLLSVETANILQLLGFNFREAIGEPLTRLTAKTIESKINSSEQLQLETTKREQLYIQLAMDPEAFERFKSLFGR